MILASLNIENIITIKLMNSLNQARPEVLHV